ncbi:MAG: hypothetical protein K2L76_04010 [Muribaculaceae bacterium]|nr:hypothetical protein [Muribaculaceae bacterium]
MQTDNESIERRTGQPDDYEDRLRRFRQELAEQEARRRNTDAEAAICMSVAGIILAGIPYFGWPYLAACFYMAVRGLRKEPRGAAAAALLLDLLMLAVKYVIATTP